MIYLQIFVSGILGMLLQAAVKIKAQNDRTPETIPVWVIFKNYFRKEFPILLMSIILIFIIMIGYDNALKVPEEIIKNLIPDWMFILVKFFRSIAIAAIIYNIQSVIMVFNKASDKGLKKLGGDETPTA